ncbi:MAG: OB-fold nucleic acid binding domain-containing protein, partial [Actinomycetota bacterium]|nr:OB-fold nucleic acid binding domain-containing protein [Actinomycetota bacterium]
LQQLFELCVEIDGFPRHLALHPSGVILSSSDLADRVPMQESFQGFTMLQADKDDVEELGLVKLDVLGVRMLSSIAHANDEIDRLHGQRVDLDGLRHDDGATYRLASSSQTLGCFQIESPGQRELLARMQPKSFEDLIVEISLFRPGPVKSDMVSPFLDRRHGFQDTTYAHQRLVEILKETNGVVVYHEQVIRVIAAVTGCSLDDADFVRRHLDAERPSLPDDPGHKPERKLGEDWVKNERVRFHGVAGPIEVVPPEKDVEGWFVASAINNGFAPAQARLLWKEVFAFASFGFCKSHAAAFALPTYISVYLKAHYPAEFLAGVLTHDPGMYPRRAIVADARVFGIPILPIDVNESDIVYRAERVSPGEDPLPATLDVKKKNGADGRMGIRLSLAQVRGISDVEMDSIIRARAEGGRFRSLEDLWRRTELSRPVLENLVHVGAVDSIEKKRSRRELLWRAIELASEVKVKAAGSGRSEPVVQLSLTLDEPIRQSLPELPDYDAVEKVEAELEVSGIDSRQHLMELYRPLAQKLGCVDAGDLRRTRNRSEVWVAGVKVSTQTPAIRSGQRIIFLTIDDTTGPIEVTAFERVQPRCARTIFHSWLLLVRGEVRKRGGASRRQPMQNNVGITVVVEEVFDLAELAKTHDSGISIAEALGLQRERQARAAGIQDAATEAPAKLWHASGGSSGR